MVNRVACSLLLVLCFLVSCNRDPEAAKKRYVDNGNKYYEKGKYKEALIMYRNALKKDLKYGEAYYRSALAEIRLQRWVDAVRSLQRAVELQPDNMDALNKLSDIWVNAYLADRKRPKPLLAEIRNVSSRYTKRFPNTYEDARLKGYLALFEGDSAKALTFFEKANKIKPYQTDVVLVYMQSLTVNKQPEAAEKLGYEMLAKHPDALPVYDALVLMYARQNRTADVERILKTQVEKNPKVLRAQLQLAAHYYTTQRRDEMMAVLNRVSSSDKDFPQGPISVGDFFLRIKEYDLAAQSFRKGAERSPKDKAIYEKRMIEVLVRQEKKDEAMRLVNNILKENPKDDEAIAMRASLSLMAGNKDQIQAAIGDLQTVVNRMPENPVLRYNLGRALLARNNVSGARVQFEEAIKLRPDYILPRINLAQILIQNKEWGKAARMTDEILTYDRSNVVARLLRSRALIGMGDTAQARTVLAGTSQQFPELPEAKLQIAALDLQEKNYKNAEEGFRTVYEKHSDPRAFMGLIDTYVGQRQFATAQKLLRDQSAKHPDRVEYRVALASVAMRSGDPNGAVSEFKSILEKMPNNPAIWLQLSEAYRLSGNMPQAIEATRKAHEAAPTNTAANLQLALLYESTGQRDQAKPMYEQVLKIQPDNVIALNNLAFILAEGGADLDQALTMAQRARQAVPNNSDVADTLGWIYIKKNLPDSAIPIFKELTVKEPNRATFHYHLAMALFQKGDKLSAKRALEEALQAKPQRDEESRIRELMSRIG